MEKQIDFTIVHTSTNKHHFERALKEEEILYYSTEPVGVGPCREDDFNKGYYVPPEKVGKLYELLEKEVSPDNILSLLKLEYKSPRLIIYELEKKLNLRESNAVNYEERQSATRRYDEYVRVCREEGQVGIQPQYDPNSPNQPPPWPCTKEDMEF